MHAFDDKIVAGVYLLYKGQFLPNNSAIGLNDVIKNTHNISCVTNLRPCCDQPQQQGVWYHTHYTLESSTTRYNNGTIVLSLTMSNVINEMLFCVVNNSVNEVQHLYVGIYQLGINANAHMHVHRIIYTQYDIQ